MLREAIAIGRRFGDPDIEFDALGYLGGLFVMTDRDRGGIGLHRRGPGRGVRRRDDRVATVDGIFCGFFWACELVNDVPRADQWMRAAADLMKRRNVVAAFCRAHYGGILTAAGRWDEAETELLEAAGDHFDRGMSTRRDGGNSSASPTCASGRAVRGSRPAPGRPRTPPRRRPHARRPPLRAGRECAAPERCWSGPLPGRTTRCPRSASRRWSGPLLALLVDVYLAEGQGRRGRPGSPVASTASPEAQGGPYLRGIRRPR